MRLVMSQTVRSHRRFWIEFFGPKGEIQTPERPIIFKSLALAKEYALNNRPAGATSWEARQEVSRWENTYSEDGTFVPGGWVYEDEPVASGNWQRHASFNMATCKVLERLIAG